MEFQWSAHRTKRPHRCSANHRVSRKPSDFCDSKYRFGSTTFAPLRLAAAQSPCCPPRISTGNYIGAIDGRPPRWPVILLCPGPRFGRWCPARKAQHRLCPCWWTRRCPERDHFIILYVVEIRIPMIELTLWSGFGSLIWRPPTWITFGGSGST